MNIFSPYFVPDTKLDFCMCYQLSIINTLCPFIQFSIIPQADLPYAHLLHGDVE